MASAGGKKVKKETRLTKESKKVLEKYEKELRREAKDIESLYKKSAVLYARGETLVFMGKYDEALSAFNKAIEIDPDHKSVWVAKATLLAKMDKANEAILSYNRAIELDPKDKDLRNKKEELMRKIGMPKEEAAEKKERIVVPPPLHEERRILPEIVSRIEVEREMVSERAKGVRESIRTYATMPRYKMLIDLARDVTILVSVVIFALIFSQYSISRTFWNVHFPMFNSLVFSTVIIIVIVGILYLIIRIGELKNELKRFWVFAIGVVIIIFAPLHETFALWPFGGLWSFYNILIMAIGTVIACVGAVLLAKVKGYFFAWLLGVLIFGLETSHEYLRAVVWSGHYGTYDQTIGFIGIAVTFTGSGLFAYNWLSSRWKITRLDGEFRKGNVLGKLGRYEDAILHYNRALNTDRRFVAAWNNKGNALSRLGRYLDAISCYDEALAINPYYEYALNNKAITLTKMERYEDALECYDKAIKLNPRYREAWENKVAVLETLGKEKEAAECLSKISEIEAERKAVER